MEIEKKYTVTTLPENLDSFPFSEIEQAYLCTDPVLRIRKENQNYYLTYKSKGLMVREEYNLPLTPESYNHLKQKADGNILTKKRYRIPYGIHTIELDLFSGKFEGLIIAEVEFDSEQEALTFTPLNGSVMM